MTKSELFALTTRLRRTFPRHADVLALCGEAESLATVPTVSVEETMERVYDMHYPPKRNRAEYMREYRKRRKAWNGGRGYVENTVPNQP